MTKYDIRLRRKALSKGQIERHKDFKGLYHKEPDEQRKAGSWFRIIAIVLAVLAIGAMIFLGVERVNEKVPVPDEQDSIDVFDEFKSE